MRTPSLERLRHAAVIALGLRLWRPPADSVAAGTPAPDGLLCVIDRFSPFQGTLRIAGWAHLPGAALRGIELRLPGGGRYPLRRFGLASPDVAARHGPGAAHARFDETLPVTEPPLEAVQAALVLRFEGRPERVVTDLGRIGPTDPAHALYPRFLEMLRERPAGRLLEVGSRARSGITRREAVPEGWDYTGLDVKPGPNVDVTGDAHRLSRLFPDRRFDAVMAFSVLEHLLMPWKFVVELNRVLNPGAIGLFTTHQAWPLHDTPWDFWRFSDTAWSALLNPATGFEILAARLGERVFVVAEKAHPVTAFEEAHPAWGLSVVLFRKVGETTLDWPVDPDEVLRTEYPA